MLKDKIIANWKKIIGLPLVLIAFVCTFFTLTYSSSVLSPIISGKINFYWWEQIFKNGQLTLIQLNTYNNINLILSSLIYICFLIMTLWSLIDKNKNVLSLIFFILFSIISLTITNVFLSLNDSNSFQVLFTLSNKFCSLILLFCFIYQVFSVFWKKK